MRKRYTHHLFLPKYGLSSIVAGVLTVLGLLASSPSVFATGGYTWTTGNGLSSAICANVAASSTGQYMACANASGGDIYTSSDYGADWIDQANSGSKNWDAIAVSGTGQYMAADVGGSDVWLSSDYGTTWTDHPVSAAQDLGVVTMSNTGQYISISDTGSDVIYQSQDYGTTWTTVAPASAAADGLSMSDSGQYQVVGYDGGDIYTSSDYGTTWTDSMAAGSHNWASVSMSEDGQYIAAAAGDGTVLRSSDFGVTWNNISPSGGQDWNSVLISNDGQSLILSQYYYSFPQGTIGNVYESYDAGTTWATDPGLPSNGGWSPVSGSRDRSRLVIRNIGNNDVYVGYNPALYVPPPLVTPSPTNGATSTVAVQSNAHAPDTGFGTLDKPIVLPFILLGIGIVTLLGVRCRVRLKAK